MDLIACPDNEQPLERAETKQQDSQSRCTTASSEQAQIIAEITPVAVLEEDNQETSGDVIIDECMTSLPQLYGDSDLHLELEKSCSQTESATLSTSANKDATEAIAEGQTDILGDDTHSADKIATEPFQPGNVNESTNVLEGKFEDINETVTELDKIGDESDDSCFVPDSQPPIHGETIGFSSSPPSRAAETTPLRGDAVHSFCNDASPSSPVRSHETTEASIQIPSRSTCNPNDVHETSVEIECQHDHESAIDNAAGLSEEEMAQNLFLIDDKDEPGPVITPKQDDLLEGCQGSQEPESPCRAEIEAVRTIVGVPIPQSQAERALDGEPNRARPNPGIGADTSLLSELQLESSIPIAIAVDPSGTPAHSPTISTHQDNASSEPQPVTHILTERPAASPETAPSHSRATTPITACQDDTVNSAETEANETREESDIPFVSNDSVEAAPDTNSMPGGEAEEQRAVCDISNHGEPSVSNCGEPIDVVASDKLAVSEEEIPATTASLDQEVMVTSSAVTESPLVPASPTRSYTSIPPNNSLSAQSSLHDACTDMRETPAKAKGVTLPQTSTPSAVARPQKTGIPGQTYFGGMLASNKAMRPFRSPMISRKDPKVSSTSASSVDEPGTSAPVSEESPVANSSSSSLGRNKLPSASTPSRPSPLSHRKSSLNSTSAPSRSQANPALNKPFKSLVSNLNPRNLTTVAQPSSHGTDMVDDEGNCVNSLWLSMALPKMERRLALLKDAKRHRQAREKMLDSADNTDHILELSAKWLEKGREAAEMLWELVKDNMDSANDQMNKDTANFNDSGNWGWDSSASEGPTTYENRRNWGGGSTERLTVKLQEQIDALPEDARQDMYDHLEREGSLPEIDTDTGCPSRSAKRESAAPSNNRPKRRRLEQEGSHQRCSSREQSPQSDTEGNASPDVDNDALSDTTHDGPEKLQDLNDNGDSKMESEDDPMQRGIAKMLTQCGIDAKTLRWEPTLEEWERVDEDM